MGKLEVVPNRTATVMDITKTFSTRSDIMTNGSILNHHHPITINDDYINIMTKRHQQSPNFMINDAVVDYDELTSRNNSLDLAKYLITEHKAFAKAKIKQSVANTDADGVDVCRIPLDITKYLIKTSGAKNKLDGNKDFKYEYVDLKEPSQESLEVVKGIIDNILDGLLFPVSSSTTQENRATKGSKFSRFQRLRKTVKRVKKAVLRPFRSCVKNQTEEQNRLILNEQI